MTEKQINYKKKIVKDFNNSISTTEGFLEIWEDPFEPTPEELQEYKGKIEKGKEEIKEMKKILENDNFQEMIDYHKKHFYNAFYG